MTKEGYLGAVLGVAGIIVGVITAMYPQIPPIVGWPVVAILALAAFAMCDTLIRKSHDEVRHQEHRSVDAIRKRVALPLSHRMALNEVENLMESVHGHSDHYGLEADLLDGIPVGDLLKGTCSQCNRARNRKGGYVP